MACCHVTFKDISEDNLHIVTSDHKQDKYAVWNPWAVFSN